VASLVALARTPSGEPAATIAVLAYHPPFVEPFLSWAAALALRGALNRREHEILALRTALNARSGFEWGEHVGWAAGHLSGEEIQRIAEGASARGWTDHEQALIVAADELHDRQDLTSETWRRLAGHYQPAQLVEIVYVVGQYTMLSMVANAFAVPSPAGFASLP
jgi:alkylhydroperoxidase family enzyme